METSLVREAKGLTQEEINTTIKLDIEDCLLLGDYTELLGEYTEKLVNFLETRTFSPNGFSQYPLCKDIFYNKNGEGCLITAFFLGGYGLAVNHVMMRETISALADKYLNTNKIPVEDSYSGHIMVNYDNPKNCDDEDLVRDPMFAIELIWDLIEALPNKETTNNYKEVIEQKVCAISK